MDNISLVFDIDDTICNNNNRDYENAIPIKEVIDKINNLYDKGAKITLYTSRGMVSCNENIDKIIKKNKDVLERWLEKNNVKYHKLIFGKPLGDLYVDDKGMNVKDFLKQEFTELNGHSGYKVTRIGNLVKKEMTPENAIKLSDWYNISKDVAKSPKIVSNLYSTVYLEYIDGVNANKVLNMRLLKQLINQILKFKEVKLRYFDAMNLLNKLEKHKSKDIEWNKMVDECEYLVSKIDMVATLSHYDFTLSNIIVKDKDIYLLDSLFDINASSYLLDFAKLKMSLDGYDELFCGEKHINKRYSKYLSKVLKKLGILREVLVLEYMWAIRLYNYNDNKDLVKKFALERRKDIWL